MMLTCCCLQMTAIRIGFFVFAVITGVALFGYEMIASNKCDMDANLRDLLMYTANALEVAAIPYFLDYGTLLGITRDHKIVPWEFDNDMGMMEEHCAAVLSMKDKFWAEMGYKMYGRNEHIPEKVKWGFGGTITMPCVRVYHTNPVYSLDLYWYKRVSASEVDAAQPALYPPPNYVSSRDGALICNHEGWTGELPGGCRLESDMFPLTKAVMYGKAFPVPAHAAKVCSEMYGADWETPRPKGYKAILCPPIWNGNANFYSYLLVVGVIGLAATFWMLRTRYVRAVEHARYAPVASSDDHSHTREHANDSNSRGCCGDDGCCARNLFNRVFVWTGAPPLPTATATASGVGGVAMVAPTAAGGHHLV